MTAHRKARRAVAKKPTSTPRRASKPAPQRPSRGWPGVVRYAIDDTRRTVRFCAIILVVGVVLAALIVLRLWL
jgi:hypothetical protein